MWIYRDLQGSAFHAERQSPAPMATPNTTTSMTKPTFAFSTPMKRPSARTRWPGSFSADPAKEPERARKALESHLARARWMTEVGYRHLAAGRYPGAERDPTDMLQRLQLLTLPLDGRSRH